MISDMRQNILSDRPEIEAINSRKAVQTYLDSIGDKSKFTRSGDNDVHIKTQPIKYKNGSKYLNGRCTWFKII